MLFSPLFKLPSEINLIISEFLHGIFYERITDKRIDRGFLKSNGKIHNLYTLQIVELYNTKIEYELKNLIKHGYYKVWHSNCLTAHEIYEEGKIKESYCSYMNDGLIQ